jgi:hypothetical protein
LYAFETKWGGLEEGAVFSPGRSKKKKAAVIMSATAMVNNACDAIAICFTR